MSNGPSPSKPVNPANDNHDFNDKAPAPNYNVPAGGNSSDAVPSGQYLPSKQ